MNTDDPRYHRNMLLFGAQGQESLSRKHAVIAGVGGLGSPIAQQLVLLGVQHLTLIEPEELDDTNRNRFVGARSSDPVPGSLKASLARRMILEINPSAVVTVIPEGLVSPAAFAAVEAGDWVFGCFDHDGPRFVLNELCAAHEKPYVDLASDVPEPGVYGGRVCVAHDGAGCLACLDLLDMKAVDEWLAAGAFRAARDKIYGIDRTALSERKGPSVAPINGVVASLGATEFMVAATGMRAPRLLLNYYGHLGKVTDGSGTSCAPYCHFCQGIRGRPHDADLGRYLRMPHLRRHHPVAI